MARIGCCTSLLYGRLAVAAHRLLCPTLYGGALAKRIVVRWVVARSR